MFVSLLRLAALAATSGVAVPSTPSPVLQDPLLQRTISVAGQQRDLEDLANEIGDMTGRRLILSQFVPKREVFAGTTGEKAAVVLDELAEFLGDRNYTYYWPRYGYADTPVFTLTRRPRHPRAEAEHARKLVLEVLAKQPPFRANLEEQARGIHNDAEPARLAMLKSLPPPLLDRVLRRALAGERVIVPLSLFDRATLQAAHGSTRVISTDLRTGERRVSFSYEEVDRGNGFVALSADRGRNGLLDVKLKIGSGPPPPPNQLFPGPVKKLIYGSDNEAGLTRGAPEPPNEPAPPWAEPAVRVTLRARISLRKQESPLENVLRQLTDQSKRLVLAEWSPRSSVSQRRLEADLVDLPVAEAVSAIARCYELTAVVRERTITFKAKSSRPASKK